MELASRSADQPPSSTATSGSTPDTELLQPLFKANTAQTRKSKPKVRTGCLTCKVRRVKCDEGKPFCNRCTKADVVCDGYLLAFNPKAASAAVERKVLLRPKKVLIRPKKVAIPRMNAYAVILDRGIRSGTGFETELDAQCFNVYLQESAREISGTFPAPLWEKLIPLISEDEPFVRHAIIAIGALGKESRSGSRHYDKSIRAMRDAIAAGRHDIHKALVACLLVFCLEGMLGNQCAAAIHAQRGLMLLHQWITGNNPFGGTARTTKALQDARFEDDLLQAFNALDSQVLMFIDTRSKSLHQDIKTMLNYVIATMPREITSLDQARHYWQLIMNRNYHFCKSFQQTDVEAMKEERETSQGGSVTMEAAELLGSEGVNRSISLREEQLHYREDIRQWQLAFATLYDKICTDNIESAVASANILQVHARSSNIMLAGTFFVTECEYDAFLPDFQDIVALSQPVLSYLQSTYSGTAPRFNVDIGIVAPLFLAGSRCRFDETRQKAIDMLFAANYREGIWDALAVAHISHWLRGLEVEGADLRQWIPEERRAVLNAVNIDLYSRKGTFGAVQKGNDGPIQSNTTIAW